MNATLAIIIDSYRELNSRKLFWVVLILSGLIVAVLGATGIDARGFTFLHWSLGFGINTAIMSKELFYKQVLFVNLGIQFWLGAVATILALISTASIIPDFVSGGTVELSLSKPLSRVRLFLTKYLCGLMFVALQVAVFSVACFLIIGLRAGSWEPRILLAIPLVTLFFSYLFCVCALLGLITRSSVAAMLITLLLWCASFLITVADDGIAGGKLIFDQRHDRYAELLQKRKADVDRLTASDVAMDKLMNLPLAQSKLKTTQERVAENDKWRKRMYWIAFTSGTIKTILPKVGETKTLLERSLLSDQDRKNLVDDEPNPVAVAGDDDIKIDQNKVQRQMLDRKHSRPLWWVLGTSLLFEILILGIACRIFAQRDF